MTLKVTLVDIKMRNELFTEASKVIEAVETLKVAPPGKSDGTIARTAIGALPPLTGPARKVCAA